MEPLYALNLSMLGQPLTEDERSEVSPAAPPPTIEHRKVSCDAPASTVWRILCVMGGLGYSSHVLLTAS